VVFLNPHKLEIMDQKRYPLEVPYSLWLIDRQGNFRRLYTPFRVQVISPVGPFTAGTLVYVEEIWDSGNCPIIFKISGQWYCFRHFKIPFT
jgi:hypothetical protein